MRLLVLPPLPRACFILLLCEQLIKRNNELIQRYRRQEKMLEAGQADNNKDNKKKALDAGGDPDVLTPKLSRP